MLETIGLEILKKIVPEIVKNIGGGVEQTLKSKISNACHRYDEDTANVMAKSKSSVLGCGNLYRLTMSM